MTSIFGELLSGSAMFINNFTVNIEALAWTYLSENNVIITCLISRINNLCIIKPPSINFCNLQLMVDITIISINTLTKDSV
jgi:hypothetical protein